jgi:hypothetical protein
MHAENSSEIRAYEGLQRQFASPLAFSTMSACVAKPLAFSAAVRGQALKPRAVAKRTSVRVAAMALSQDELKQQAAFKAVEYIKSGMVVGLGTGSTAAFAVARLGALLKSGAIIAPTVATHSRFALGIQPHSTSVC